MNLLLLGLACKAPTPPPTDVPTVGDTQDTATGDTAPPIPTADTAPELDCSTRPPPPAPGDIEVLTGFTYAEDFDFDDVGNQVSVRSVNGNLIAMDMNNSTSLISPNVAGTAACTRRLPDGDWVVCNVTGNSLVRVDAATGAKNTLISGLAYPNGADVDAEGFIYVAEQNAGRLRRVNSVTGDSEVLGTNLASPNGVVLSPDEQTVYAVSFGAGTVYAIDRIGPDEWGDPRVHTQNPGGNGDFDGLEADACGNLYITEYIDGIVWQVPPSGQNVIRFAELNSSWIPNLRWGTGVGGWERDKLYVSDRDQGRIFVLPVGIPGAGSWP